MGSHTLGDVVHGQAHLLLGQDPSIILSIEAYEMDDKSFLTTHITAIFAKGTYLNISNEHTASPPRDDVQQSGLASSRGAHKAH